MNQSYPTSTADYDFAFLDPFLRGVFETDELRECGETGYIKNLGRDKLKFAKGYHRYFKLSLENIQYSIIY